MEKKIYSSLCIFTEMGKTFTFKNVSILTDNETMLVFAYKAMSDGLTKVGRFFKGMFVGFSTTD